MDSPPTPSHTKAKDVGFLLVLPKAGEQGSRVTQRKHLDTIPNNGNEGAGVA